MALTPKQARFVHEYLVDLNATQAAIRAGYAPRTARIIAAENLSKPNIQEAIQTERARITERTDISIDRLVRALSAVVFCDIAVFYETKEDEDGIHFEVKALEDIPAELRGIIQGIRRTRAGDEYVLPDKLKALELLGKHLGLFDEKQQDSGVIRIELSDELAQWGQ